MSCSSIPGGTPRSRRRRSTVPHRIGQDRTAIAYRLLTAGTVEEKIFELQQRKAALSREILGESALGCSLTREDLEYLFAET